MDVYFAQQLVNGLSIGMAYALLAIGFTLIFGVLGAINFAHGELYTLGAFGGLILITAISPPLIVVFLIVLAFGSFLGFGLERLAFKPFRRFTDEASLKSRAIRESTLLSSLAVGIVAREVIERIYGADMQYVPSEYLLNDPIRLGPLKVSTGDIIIFAGSAAMLAAIQYILHRTRIGLSIRAISNNTLGALYVGINIDRAVIATFMVGAALGAAAGILVGLHLATIYPYMGLVPVLKAFVAMLMGGLTSIPGAVICAILLGVSEALVTEILDPRWTDAAAYTFLVITLIFFPQGLFGHGRQRS